MERDASADGDGDGDGATSGDRGIVVQAAFFRRRGRSVGVSRVPVVESRAATPRPLAVARMLALAHEIVRLVDEGRFADLADAARLLGFTRARITQLVDLTPLAPAIQEAVLFAEVGAGRDHTSGRRLRALVRMSDWRAQERAYATRRREHWGGEGLATMARPPTNKAVS